MALSHDEEQELMVVYGNMSAEELRGAKGDDADHDALIEKLLDAGKAVEVKNPAAADEDPAPAPAAKKPAADDSGEDDEGEDDPNATGFVDEHGRPVPDPNGDEAKAAAASAEAVAAAAAQAQADADAEAAAAATAASQEKLAPLDLSFLDTQFSDRLKAMNVEKSTNFAAMMDGTMSAEDYATYEAKYLDSRDALQQEKRWTADWYGQIHSFKQQALNDSGINYDTDPAKQASWDAWVKHLANTKPGHPDAWYLEQAHKKVMIEFEVAPRAAAPAAAQNAGKNVAPAKKVANKQGRAPDLSQIPPTISTLPSATSVDGGQGGEFAYLDNLAGLELERAIASLRPDQKARWEAM